MSGSPSTAQTHAVSEPTRSMAQAATAAEVDASCRGPLLLMYASGAVWLVVSSVLGMLASLKLHSGDFLVDCPWLTYGRLYPAFSNTFLYGFAVQVAMATAAWLVCRLGRVVWQGAWLALIGAAFWNLGVTVGVVAILGGNNTGFEWLEFPRNSALLLFASYAVIAVQVLLAFHGRAERQLYPSQWYILVALFVFPWAFSAAAYLLLCQPVRGVVQLAVHTWYASNLLYLFLVPIGVAVLYYFIPKLLGKVFEGAVLARFALGALLVVGGWIGLTTGSPLPSWLVSLSLVAGTLLAVPILATAVTLHRTVNGAYRKLEASGPIRFFGFSAVSLLVAGLVTAVISIPEANESVQFTHFMTAIRRLWLYAFFAMGAFGSIYYIVPKLVGVEWPSKRLMDGHFWLAVLGTVPTIGVVAAGGYIQGHEMAKLGVPFSEVIRLTLPALRFSTLGEILLLGAHVMLLANLGLMFRQVCTACCKNWCSASGLAAKAGGGR